jgi:hypothetical protein
MVVAGPQEMVAADETTGDRTANAPPNMIDRIFIFSAFLKNYPKRVRTRWKISVQKRCVNEKAFLRVGRNSEADNRATVNNRF